MVHQCLPAGAAGGQTTQVYFHAEIVSHSTDTACTGGLNNVPIFYRLACRTRATHYIEWMTERVVLYARISVSKDESPPSA